MGMALRQATARSLLIVDEFGKVCRKQVKGSYVHPYRQLVLPGLVFVLAQVLAYP